MKGEISFDLVMEDSMDFVEGTFRLPDGDWRVFIISKGAAELREVRASCWASGATGVVIRVPASEILNKKQVERILTEVAGADTWDEVRGPDSMRLR